LLIFEVLQSLIRTGATKVNVMFVFRELQQHAVDIWNPEPTTGAPDASVCYTNFRIDEVGYTA
jgi:hypothetical protein